MYIVVIQYTCTLWKDSPSHEHIYHLTYLSFSVCQNIWVFSKFQLYNAILSTTVTMFHIRSSELTHFIAESFYSFTNLSLFSLPPAFTPLRPRQPVFTLCCHEFDFLEIPQVSDTMQYLSICGWLTSLTIMPSQWHYNASCLLRPNIWGFKNSLSLFPLLRLNTLLPS